MKITFKFLKTVGSRSVKSEVVCGDDSQRFFIPAWNPAPSVQAEPQPHPRSETIDVVHRGNRSWQISWVSSISLASDDDAAEFATQHAIDCTTAEGTLEREIKGNVKSWQGVIAQCSPVQRGCSVTTQYSFIGSDPT